MKKLIATTTVALGVASFAHAEEPTKHAQVGIASFATVISNDIQGVQDDEFAGFSLYATGAPTDNFGVRGLYGQQEHDDIEGLDVSAFEVSVLAGTGLATEGCLRLSEEADAIDWFSPESLPASTLPRHIERISDSIATEGFPFMRVQA